MLLSPNELHALKRLKSFGNITTITNITTN
jgi:hypothetical protein